jgi:peroxiredoxin
MLFSLSLFATPMRAETRTLRYLQKTPYYRLTNHEGEPIAQHHFTGHTHSVLYFLESVRNARCRDYCRELSQRLPTARLFKTAIVGIAPDSVEELARAHQELQLAFPLASDPGSEVARAYGFLERPWWGQPRLRPGVVVHDKYGIAYFLAVAEDAGERPDWSEIEATLRGFHRG